ncbi:argininosuccinate lyase [Cohnella cholangitidis]|uniref:Argininosuccinate lyase n=2 Tax=Cohnella cholangitidis TaxID=2598458 RepID=A0A7G5C747_9BACL|nr:argininosuccinate lyase [Cohnella cholangitidis]
MIAVNKAHLIMLSEQRLISGQQARTIAQALLGLDCEKLRSRRYTGQFEDLFFEVEHDLLESAGEPAGNLHLARSRNDMGIAIYRIVLRGKLLGALESAFDLRQRLIEFAGEHVETLMLGYTHTQQAQPTTMAHYIAAVSDSLTRDIRRLKSAYANCNRSSMGAAALTTSGFSIDRARVAELLAFDGLIENAYDAVSGADYVGEIATAVSLAAVNMGRFAQELLLWSSQEFAAIRVAAPYVQISSIMPQKRNPVSIEHIRSLLSSCAGDAGTVLAMIHNTPFGDIVDTEDDLQPYAWKSLRTLESVYRLLARIFASLEVNKDELRARAERSFATVTELADTLVRKEGLTFRSAHKVVARLVRKIGEEEGLTVRDLTLERLKEAARSTIGRSIGLSGEELAEALDPVYFVAVRKLLGGPSPQEVKRALAVQTERSATEQAWLSQKKERLIRANTVLDDILGDWIRSTDS